MAEPTKRAALPNTNEPYIDTEHSQGRQHLFIQVQPETSGSTPMPLRTVARKHVLRNRPRESLEIVTPGSTEREAASMQKLLNRFRLDGENRSGYMHRTLKPLAARPNLSLGLAKHPASDLSPSDQLYFVDEMPIQDPVTSYRRDPFTRFPIKADDRVQYLFTFYLNDLNNKSLSEDPKRDFIPIVLGNVACFHVLMATLLQYQRFQGAQGGACFWYHRGAAITALNEELSIQHAHITDTMFLTVCMLLYVESRVPSLRSQTASLHMAALIKFLDLRKGKLRIELYSMLLRVATWCSINPPLTRPPSMAPIQEQDVEFNFELKLPCNEQEFTPFPGYLFDNLKVLMHLTTDLDDGDERRNQFYKDFVSRCLLRASTSLLTPANTNVAESHAERCIQLGQILYLYTICPSMSISGFYSQSIAVALRGCLEAGWGGTGNPVIWSPEILCWLLLNGAVTKQARSLQVWYIKRVAEFTRLQNLQTFDQLEALLYKTAWTEDQFGSACRSIWKEILVLQASEF